MKGNNVKSYQNVKISTLSKTEIILNEKSRGLMIDIEKLRRNLGNFAFPKIETEGHIG